MSDAACARVRRNLGAFIDGELVGAARQFVAHHLSECELCVGEERAIRDLGDRLRRTAPAAGPALDLSGLAGGVISRVRAEQAQSWRALYSRALDDWHWVLVGAGSLAAGFFSVAFLSALLWFGPSPQREDSLESLLNNLGQPAGTLLIIATPVGRNQDSMLMQFDSAAVGFESGGPVRIPLGFSGPTERDLVEALAQTMVAADGRMSDLRAMSHVKRQRAEALLDEIQRLRYSAPTPWSGGQVAVRRLGLVTNMVCTGKALTP
jgi:hypothetical protein